MLTLSEPLFLASVILVLQNLPDIYYFKFPFTEYDFEIRKVNTEILFTFINTYILYRGAAVVQSVWLLWLWTGQFGFGIPVGERVFSSPKLPDLP